MKYDVVIVQDGETGKLECDTYEEALRVKASFENYGKCQSITIEKANHTLERCRLFGIEHAAYGWSTKSGWNPDNTVWTDDQLVAYLFSYYIAKRDSDIINHTKRNMEFEMSMRARTDDNYEGTYYIKKYWHPDAGKDNERVQEVDTLEEAQEICGSDDAVCKSGPTSEWWFLGYIRSE